jgi:hypothetical protein
MADTPEDETERPGDDADGSGITASGGATASGQAEGTSERTRGRSSKFSLRYDRERSEDSHEKRSWRVSYTVFIVFVVSIAAAFVIWLIVYSGGGSDASKAGSASSAGASRSTATPTRSTNATTSVVDEYSDNHQGSPVFAGPDGTPVKSGPSRIPFGTLVHVKCKVPNQTGMTSVSALYLIADGDWAGAYVVADTMTNGGPLGSTDSPNVDPQVPDCS